MPKIGHQKSIFFKKFFLNFKRDIVRSACHVLCPLCLFRSVYLTLHFVSVIRLSIWYSARDRRDAIPTPPLLIVIFLLLFLTLFIQRDKLFHSYLYLHWHRRLLGHLPVVFHVVFQNTIHEDQQFVLLVGHFTVHYRIKRPLERFTYLFTA